MVYCFLESKLSIGILALLLNTDIIPTVFHYDQKDNLEHSHFPFVLLLFDSVYRYCQNSIKFRNDNFSIQQVLALFIANENYIFPSYTLLKVIIIKLVYILACRMFLLGYILCQLIYIYICIMFIWMVTSLDGVLFYACNNIGVLILQYVGQATGELPEPLN